MYNRSLACADFMFVVLPAQEWLLWLCGSSCKFALVWIWISLTIEAFPQLVSKPVWPPCVCISLLTTYVLMFANSLKESLKYLWHFMGEITWVMKNTDLESLPYEGWIFHHCQISAGLQDEIGHSCLILFKRSPHEMPCPICWKFSSQNTAIFLSFPDTMLS